MPTTTREHFQSFGAAYLPGHLGVEIVTVGRDLVESRMAVAKQVMAPNGYLPAASAVALPQTVPWPKVHPPRGGIFKRVQGAAVFRVSFFSPPPGGRLGPAKPPFTKPPKPASAKTLAVLFLGARKCPRPSTATRRYR